MEKLSDSELIDKKIKMEFLLNKNMIKKDEINCLINQQEDHINQIIYEIQNRCKHNWIRECSGGPYPDKWSQCSICNKIVDFRCG